MSCKFASEKKNKTSFNFSFFPMKLELLSYSYILILYTQSLAARKIIITIMIIRIYLYMLRAVGYFYSVNIVVFCSSLCQKEKNINKRETSRLVMLNTFWQPGLVSCLYLMHICKFQFDFLFKLLMCWKIL